MRNLVSNTAWFVCGQGFRVVATFVVGFWVIRYLGPARFGEFSSIRAVLAILSVFASMGLTQLLPIRLASHKEPATKTLATAGLLRMAGGLIAAMISIPVLSYIQGYDSAHWEILLVAAIYLVLHPLELLDTWFVSQSQSRFMTFSKMGQLAVTSGMQVVAVISGFGLLAFVAIDVARVVIYGAFLLFFMKKYLRPEGRLEPDVRMARDLFRSTRPLWFAAAATIISVKVDQTMIRLLLDREATGLYAAAARLSEFWFFLPVAVVTTTIPTLTRQYKNDRTAYNRSVLRVSSVLTSFSIAVAFCVTMFSDPVVAIIFGQDYIASTSVLVIHVWSLPFLSLVYLSHNIRIIQGQQASLLPRTIAGAATNIVLNYLLIPLYGIKAAAITTLISYVVVGIGWDLLIDRSHGLGRIQARSFLPQHWIGAAMTVSSRIRAARG